MGKAAQGFAVPAHGTGRRTSVRRSRKPAENAEQDKNGHLWMDTNYIRSHDLNVLIAKLVPLHSFDFSFSLITKIT